ncbi:MAG: hypothetical protein NC250_05725 [Alistipes senegalensis]|nr:hypothetical protein [Bacteroides cellulosilyticus]MCM1352212.1 hypothetical protein [Alistipes senegalensis]
MKKIVLLFVSLFMLGFSGITYAAKTVTFTVSLQSLPAGAKVYYKGQLVSMTTPATISLSVPKKEWKDRIELTFVKEGYPDKIVYIQANLLFGPMMPLSANCEFEKGAAYINDTSIQAGEAHTVVSRDNAGASALERTIIRWFFDSAPQGAQVYWRVISSIPAEVKNTNENYMGTTPYEETRSFNILGLTYENSRDVQVEVKIKKRGYYDGVKRFNVRQAIDQQEISSFYELVPKEE